MFERIMKLIDEKKYSKIKELLVNMNEFDIAEILDDLPPKQIVRIFRLLPKDIGADVFSYLESDTAALIISSLSDSEAVEIINDMYADDAADLFEEMPANVVKRILKNSDAETRKTINEILKYPDDSAGSIMTTEYVRLDEDITVEDALKRIRRTGIDKETIYTCYITKPDRTLLGYVTAKKLLLSDEDILISDIMVWKQ
jgi:magnesium transporter